MKNNIDISSTPLDILKEEKGDKVIRSTYRNEQNYMVFCLLISKLEQ
ncbi:MAG: hypothetical protein IPQ19_01730 [Bacteroidetes bacterium]|nr:hypothetical protein [Bacteroidota bacterium]